MSQLFERIDTVFLQVKTLDEAIPWYQENLGFELRWRQGGHACMNVAETPLTLWETPSGEAHTPHPYLAFNFYIKDLEACERHLQERGVQTEPILDHGVVKTLDFFDNSGNRLSVCSW
ncbi:VOC family protein [Tumebacillus sp. ITR2]|uniref:VOC family protein n=1 Tax=Tumebacillus amylolyticus TaxID=2801339 RepID=A0ABS1JAF0_9BACL|nr:VOC family protein [Tumebacillus amylolyticus]MBL0387155.1 VOC family protein [Tumebacillus amylolyticus]